jgi:putative oxidoreductase
LDFLAKLYYYLINSANWLQSLLLLVFRLEWGYQFFTTGQGKLQNHPKVVEFFTNLNIPFPDANAWFVGGVETIGGALLLVGLASRPVALVLTVNMIVAYMSVADDRATVFNILQDPSKFLQADPFFFLLTSALVLAFGAGIFSVDAILARTVFKRYVVK